MDDDFDDFSELGSRQIQLAPEDFVGPNVERDALTNIGLRPKYPPEELHRNIRSACARRIPLMMIGGPSSLRRPALIVGGSPSVKDHLKAIRSAKRKGKLIVAVNASHDYLIKHKIIPDLCVLLDPKKDLYREITPDMRVRYYVASCADPSTFDHLEGWDVHLWHANNGLGETELLESMNVPWLLVSGGSTTPMRALNILYLKGYHQFVLYGIDSSYPDGKSTHAYEDKASRWKRCEIFVDGKKFVSTPTLAKQAEDYQMVRRQMLGMGCTIRVVGDGLIPHIDMILRKRERMRQFAQMNDQDIEAINPTVHGNKVLPIKFGRVDASVSRTPVADDVSFEIRDIDTLPPLVIPGLETVEAPDAGP